MQSQVEDSMDSFPKVSVVLVNWNRAGDTLECLRSLWSSSYPVLEIIVIDNGSSDNSIVRLRQAEGPFVLLTTGDNLGFTGGNNRGMQYALEQGADYVMLLNNDTVIAPDAIEQLIRVAEADKTIGLVSPKIRFYVPTERIWFGGADFNLRYFRARMIGYGLEDVGQFDEEHDIAFASGCAMLIRRSVLETVGLLCDDFFAVMEDIDYSFRVRQQGYRVRYVPTAFVLHKESISAGGHDAPQYVYYQTRNSFLLSSRWTDDARSLVIARIYAFLYFFRRLIRFALRGKWWSIAGLLCGMLDGLLGRFGRKEWALLSKKQDSTTERHGAE